MNMEPKLTQLNMKIIFPTSILIFQGVISQNLEVNKLEKKTSSVP